MTTKAFLSFLRDFMKPILFPFSLFIITTLQASYIPTDSVHNPEFQKKFNFYAKYGTIAETKEVLRALSTIEQQNKDALKALDDSLQQSQSAYKDAHNRIILNTKILSENTVTPVNLHAQISLAQQDCCNAWYNFQTNSLNKNVIEQDAAKFATLGQIMILRQNRLQLRLQQRDLTAAQAKFQEEKKQAALEKISKTDIQSKKLKDFKKAQNQIKPLLNRMIKQTSSIQQTPSENLLSDYITKAQQESQLTQEKKQRKIIFNAQKNHERQNQLVIQREKRRQEKEAQAKISKDLQALAFQKGPGLPIIPTEAERLAQSTKDKEIARENLETNAMSQEETRTRSLLLQQKNAQKTPAVKKAEKTSIPQHVLDEAIMLAGRLANLKDYDFNPNDPNQEQLFLTTVLTFERIIDNNPLLLQTIESDCKQAIKNNLLFYQKQIQAINDKAPLQLEEQNKRSQELAVFKINGIPNVKETNRFVTLKQEDRAFLELIQQDNLLRSAIKMTELLEKKLDGSLTESLPIQNYLTKLTPEYYKDSPFLNYVQQQKKLEQSHEKKIEKSADITQANHACHIKKRPTSYTLHPKVYEKIRSEIFSLATPDQKEIEKQLIADLISKEIRFIFDDNEVNRNIQARVMVARAIQEFKTYKTSNVTIKNAHEIIKHGESHLIAIYQRAQNLHAKNSNLSKSDIHVLAQIECMVFETYLQFHCSDVLESQSQSKKASPYAKATPEKPKKGVSRKA
jgi:hypothetical protein